MNRRFLTRRPSHTLTDEDKMTFVRTAVSWISSKDIMDTCFILNFGYKALFPWPQVNTLLC